MKTIEVSDEDYDILMDLSKELQTQDNVGQAYPYYWTPSSYRLEPNLHGEGELVRVAEDGEDLEHIDDFKESHQEMWNNFVLEEGIDVNSESTN